VLLAARLGRFQVMTSAIGLRAVFPVLADGFLQLVLRLVDTPLASVIVGPRRNRACGKTEHDQSCDYKFIFE
jgi:hypothetical protein